MPKNPLPFLLQLAKFQQDQAAQPQKQELLNLKLDEARNKAGAPDPLLALAKSLGDSFKELDKVSSGGGESGLPFGQYPTAAWEKMKDFAGQNTPLRQYERVLLPNVTDIATQLRSQGRLSDRDLEAYSEELPNVWDTTDSRRAAEMSLKKRLTDRLGINIDHYFPESLAEPKTPIK